MEQYLRQGLVSDSKVLDIRQVDVSSGKILDNNVPVFVITFATQEVLMFKNAKTGEVAVGAENRVEQCMYAAVITKIEEDIDNELTGGWKVIEVGFAFTLLFGRSQCRGLTELTCFFLCLSTDGPKIGTRIPIDALFSYSSPHPKYMAFAPHSPTPYLSILLSHSSDLAAPTTHHSDCTRITTTTHSQLGILLNLSNYNTPCSLTFTLSYPSCIRQCI